jgi:hypothetical protein
MEGAGADTTPGLELAMPLLEKLPRLPLSMEPLLAE